MEEAFLITQLLPYHVNLKKRLVKFPKIYFRDSGILHYQLGIQNFDELQGHFMLGVSWEGYIIESRPERQFRVKPARIRITPIFIIVKFGLNREILYIYSFRIEKYYSYHDSKTS